MAQGVHKASVTDRTCNLLTLFTYMLLTYHDIYMAAQDSLVLKRVVLVEKRYPVDNIGRVKYDKEYYCNLHVSAYNLTFCKL